MWTSELIIRQRGLREELKDRFLQGMMPELFEKCVGICQMKGQMQRKKVRKIRSLTYKMEETQISSQGKRTNKNNRLEE